MITAARWVQLILLLGTLSIAMMFVAWAAQKSPAAIFFVGMFLVFATDLMSYQAVVLSEGLFIMSSVLAIFFLTVYLSNQKPLFLVGAAVAVSAAWLSRYAGVTWVLSGVIALLLLSNKKPWHKLIEVGSFIVIACSASVYWMWRNLDQGGTALGRPFHLTRFYGDGQLQSLETTWRLWTWRFTSDHQIVYVIGYSLLFVGLLWTFRQSIRRDDLIDRRAILTGKITLLFFSVYLGVVLFSAAFFQSDLFLDSTRIMIAPHVLLLLFIVIQAGLVIHRSRSKEFRLFCSIVALLFLILGMRASRQMVRGVTLPQNLMFASASYRDSPTIAALKRVPAQTTIYSNLGYPVLLYADKECMETPRKIDNSTQGINTNFESDFSQMKTDLLEHHALLAYFDKGDQWLVFPTLDEITSRIKLKCLARYNDGSLWTADDRAKP